MKVVIIGGVAGGATAAARIRRLNEHAEITIYERTGYISYANCGLPYFIGGVINEESKLTLQTPKSFFARFNVGVCVEHEVMNIDIAGKKVFVKDLKTGKLFEDHYDKLILAPGAKPSGMSIEGADSERIFKLRTVEDAFRLNDFVEEKNVRKAVVVGGGFIGIEIAENLTKRGIKVQLVEYASQVMAPFDYDMACQIQSQLISGGIELIMSTGVKRFINSNKGVTVVTDKGDMIEAQLVVMAVGVKPETKLAEDAGIAIGASGGIVVDEHMLTSAKDIYAVGDAVETKNYINGISRTNPLAGPANKQARIAADNICGVESFYDGFISTAVVKVFKMTAASTGLNEREAAVAGIDYDKAIIISSSHASYYPEAGSMVIKVIFEKNSGKIVGAQIVGFDGVDKRIDVFATAIKANMTAYELEKLELAYAPPYSSAKDPVNMIGFVIENIITGRVKQFHWHEVENIPRDGSVSLIDVRTAREFEKGNIVGFTNIPLDAIRERINEIPKGKPVYVHCQSGLRSYIACRILGQKGYDCKNLSGGYGFYSVVVQQKPTSENGIAPCGKLID